MTDRSPLEYHCFSCKAGAGAPCRTYSGVVRDPHKARERAVRTAAGFAEVPCPKCGAAIGEPCEQPGMSPTIPFAHTERLR
jgi:hypothetical protein